MTSCTHKELCLHHPHTITLRVEFDWRDAPDADPTGMCVIFYPLDGKGYYRCDFYNTKGGEIQLKVGKYRAVCHNNDNNLDTYITWNSLSTMGNYDFSVDFNPVTLDSRNVNSVVELTIPNSQNALLLVPYATQSPGEHVKRYYSGIQFIYTFVFGQGNGGYDSSNDEPVLTPVNWAVTVKDFESATEYDMNY